MSQILTVKLVRNGWPTDCEPEMVEESLLEKTEGCLDDENEYTTWQEWRLEDKIVKRSAHVRLKKNVAADAVAAMFA